MFSSGSDEDAAELSQNLPPAPQTEGEKEGEDGELKKQEMLVQYLRDTETFALQVERAISVINTMLYWKTTSGSRQCSPEYKPTFAFPFPVWIYSIMRWRYLYSLQQKILCFLVVQEAVQFCVTVCEFSVANSVSGVRKMLPLVWSTDAAIKDAVVQAYRRLYLNPQGDTVRSVKHTWQ